MSGALGAADPAVASDSAAEHPGVSRSGVPRPSLSALQDLGPGEEKIVSSSPGEAGPTTPGWHGTSSGTPPGRSSASPSSGSSLDPPSVQLPNPDSWEEIIAPPSGEEAPRSARARRSKWPVVWGAAGALGLSLLGAGVGMVYADLSREEEIPPAPQASDTPAASTVPPDAGAGAGSGGEDERYGDTAEGSPRGVPAPPPGPFTEVRTLTVPDVAGRIDAEWVARASEALGIPVRALAAYAGAANAVNEHYPACGLGWNTLAAIGLVESEHGTIHGSRIGENGHTVPAIMGIALTGETTAMHRDTDGGVLDGDPTWDRAVGPMQFIPSTWIVYAADGNGDGIADPQNIDDAALAAGVYLCEVGGELQVPHNWIRAISAYNPSVEYNNRVADAANTYAANAPE